MSTKLLVAVLRVSFVIVWLGLGVFGAPQPVAAATIVYVKAAAGGANNGTSWGNAYKSLQTALANSVSGEQIWVASGTYLPGSSQTDTFTLRTNVAIYGGFAGNETLFTQRKPAVNITVLSGEIGAVGASDNSYHVVTAISVDNTAVLDGFKITGGNANGGGTGQNLGGGIFEKTSSATFNNLTIASDQATLKGGGFYSESSSSALNSIVFSHDGATDSLSIGGGMYILGGTPYLSNITFDSNTAQDRGGGLYDDGSNAVLNRVTFSSNSASGSSGSGGGMLISNASPILEMVNFNSNTAQAIGAGIFSLSSTPNLTDVAFNRNVAQQAGGAIYAYGTAATLSGVTFDLNSALDGGGIYNHGSSPTLKNVTFAGNEGLVQGGGMYNDQGSSPYLYNVTFARNTSFFPGGALYSANNSYPSIYNSILWGDGTEIANDGTSSTNVNISIIQGGYTCVTCGLVLTGDPKLGILQANGGFTQTIAPGAGSAAIDAGTNSACTNPTPTDQRGVPRPQGPHCDLGAYEVRVMTFTSQASRDGHVLESGKKTQLGGAVNTKAPALLVGDDARNRRYRGFLSFKTAPLPNNAQIVRAGLSLLQQASTANPFLTQGSLTADLAKPYFGVDASLVSSDWQAPPTVKNAANFGTTLLSNGSWYASLLSGPALGKINKLGLTQFRLHFTGEQYNSIAESIAIASGNDPTPPNHPQLIVYYNP